MLESLGLVPQSSNTKIFCFKKDKGEVMFIEMIRDNDEPQNKGPNDGEGATTEGPADISSIIDHRLSQVVLGNPFVEISNMSHDPQEGVVIFINEDDEVAYKMPHKIEQYNSLSNLEKEHTKSVYLRNEEDKRRGNVETVSRFTRDAVTTIPVTGSGFS
nr:retrotransposon Orf1 [Tanacetum cinerariifolium]